LQTKQNGIWKLTEKGRNFAIEVQNGSFLQIKWKIKQFLNKLIAMRFFLKNLYYGF